MILVPFFEIPEGDRLAKNVWKLHVQVIPRSTINVSLTILYSIHFLQQRKYNQDLYIQTESMTCHTIWAAELPVLYLTQNWDRRKMPHVKLRIDSAIL